MDKWGEIKERLRHLGGSVDLLADGYELSLVKAHDGKKIFVTVYVNGFVKGEWTKVEDGKPVHPEGRFWRPMKRAAYPKKVYARAKRAFGKKEADRMVTPRVIGVVPDLGTEGAVVAHLKKHFPDLEIKANEVAS
ncbi:hypothetical protein [Billgrantia ethanolica]|uniref:Uncharacterized protein n=1 Tax=Billgrantia ethanolica TaxID=2733486 RepID=A0ABS9A658_9GAMM|nr:hypothetical protein [Halomonas ethanolica]MCE8004250.1 hypothetical protein [Halomonas ethanolica]